MRLVIQRVTEAHVKIEGHIKSAIGKGLMILVGIEQADNQQDIDWLCGKVTKMRLFSDEQGLMNLSLTDVDADILLISQFTLHASTQKGNRPSFIKSARPEQAIPLYEQLIQELTRTIGKEIQTGTFGAHMEVGLVNDGPVTIIIDSKNKE